MYKFDIELDANSKAPHKANELDSGYDLTVLGEPKVVGKEMDVELYPANYSGPKFYHSIDYIEYNVGVKIGNPRVEYEGPENRIYAFPAYSLVFPRSSVTKYNLILKNSVGVIDNLYRGNILLRFAYTFQPEDFVIRPNDVTGAYIVGKINTLKIYKVGDKCGQLIPQTFESKIEWNQVDQVDTSSRGTGGFGSTGT